MDAARAALLILEKDGWDALGVADLAKAVGMSTRTFYRYFPNKRDVFRPLLAEAGVRSRAVFQASQRPSGPDELSRLCADALVAGVQAFPGGLDGAHNAYRILMTTSELTPVWLDEAFEFERELASYLPEDLLTSTRVDPQHAKVDGRRLLAAVLFASMRVAVQEWVESASPDDLHDLTLQAVNSVLGPSVTQPDSQR